MPRPRLSSKSAWPAAAFSQETWRAIGSSVAVHLALIILMIAGWKWQLESPGPLQVELWMEGNTTQVARAPEEPEPEPEPQTTPTPKPEPTPEPTPEPPPPAPPPPAVPEPDIAAREAEIALEQAKERERAEQARLQAERLAREKAEQERQAKLAAEQKAKVEAERKAKEEAARQEKLAQEQAEQRAQEEREAKAQADLKAKQEAERKAEQARQAKEAAAQKAEADLKAKQEAARKAEAERKAKEAAAAKAEAERKAKAAAAAAAKEKALRDAFRNDIIGATGIAGGTASRNQQGGGADAGYVGQVRACIQPNVAFPPPVRSGTTNPTAQFRVQLNSDGSVSSTSLRRSSGNTAFDRAVDNGIRRCSPFPKPPSGRYPSYIDVNYQMYD